MLTSKIHCGYQPDVTSTFPQYPLEKTVQVQVERGETTLGRPTQYCEGKQILQSWALWLVGTKEQKWVGRVVLERSKLSVKQDVGAWGTNSTIESCEWPPLIVYLGSLYSYKN